MTHCARSRFFFERHAHSVDHAGLEVEEHCAGNVLAALSPVAKHAEADELRIVVAAVLAAAYDAVLAAHYLQNLVAHLVTSLARYI